MFLDAIYDDQRDDGSFRVYTAGCAVPLRYRTPVDFARTCFLALRRPMPELMGSEMASELNDAFTDALGFRGIYDHVEGCIRFRDHWRSGEPAPDTVVESVTYVETNGSIFGFDTSDRYMLRIQFATRALARNARWMSRNDRLQPAFLAECLPLPKYARTTPADEAFRMRLYDYESPLNVAFLVNTGVTACGWFQMKCLDEETSAWEIVPHPSRDDIKLHVLAFDIECAAPRGIFPKPAEHPIIQISVATNRNLRCVLTWRTTSLGPEDTHEIHVYDDEIAMIIGWAKLIKSTNPDILTGYNILGFDFDYMFKRAEHLGISAEFARFSRHDDHPATLEVVEFNSRATGSLPFNRILCEGRVIFDLFQYVRRTEKLSSYSLKSVCNKFLKNANKEDVHHSEITPMWEGSDVDRGKLARYCMRDSDLCLMLMEAKSIIVCVVELCRVSRVPMQLMLYGGARIKVLAQIMDEARRRHQVIPREVYFEVMSGRDFDKLPDADEADDADDVVDDPNSYQGATVLKPLVGYYGLENPVATLDFASLYPSIMMAHNFCYSTIITESTHGHLTKSPEWILENTNASRFRGVRFVKSSVCHGILPAILERLIEARGRAKRDMKEAVKRGDAAQEAIQNGRQLALKLCCNAVYGFTGVTFGSLACREIAASVTAEGRFMIEKTREIVLENFAGSRVIYGDTDSVMIQFSPTVPQTIPACMVMAREAMRLVNEFFSNLPPIRIEFEKVLAPYLLVNKKRYAGVKWLRETAPDSIHLSGLENVRRDNCHFQRQLITDTLNMLMNVRPPPSDDYAGPPIFETDPASAQVVVARARKLVIDRIDALRRGLVDPRDLVITKSYSKNADAYANAKSMAHIQLAKRMLKRDEGTAPHVGDRISYVIVAGTSREKLANRAEDPDFAFANRLPIDVEYYVEHQIVPSVDRIFGAIDKRPFAVPVRTHVVSQPTSTTVGIGRYFTPTPKRQKADVEL